MGSASPTACDPPPNRQPRAQDVSSAAAVECSPLSLEGVRQRAQAASRDFVRTSQELVDGLCARLGRLPLEENIWKQSPEVLLLLKDTVTFGQCCDAWASAVDEVSCAWAAFEVAPPSLSRNFSEARTEADQAEMSLRELAAQMLEADPGTAHLASLGHRASVDEVSAALDPWAKLLIEERRAALARMRDGFAEATEADPWYDLTAMGRKHLRDLAAWQRQEDRMCAVAFARRMGVGGVAGRE